MVDFSVAWDKLAQFQTADELASFFVGEGVKAEMRNPYSCAVSQWMRKATGDKSIWANSSYLGRHSGGFDGATMETKNHTPAMWDFVLKFDTGDYPALVNSLEGS